MRDFLEHQLRGKNFATGQTGTPIDFVSFHAKGRPVYVDGHVRMGISNQLATIDDGFRIIASCPGAEAEADRHRRIRSGRLRGLPGTAAAVPQLDDVSSYTAASFARKHDLADRHGVNLEGALTWAFEFGETRSSPVPRARHQRHQPAGLQRLPHVQPDGAERIPATSDNALDLDTIVKQGVRERPDVGALASRDARRATVLAWHYHDDDVPGPAAEISLALEGSAEAGEGEAAALPDRRDHSNAYTVWQGMGSPAKPSSAQYAQMEKASELAVLGGPSGLDVADGRAMIRSRCPARACRSRAGVVRCSAGVSRFSSARP